MKPKRWIYVDPWSQKCPYCGDITQYPDDVCDKCGSELLPNPRKMGDG